MKGLGEFETNQRRSRGPGLHNFRELRAAMGLTVSRKTAKNLAVRRKNERILTLAVKKC